MHHTRVVGTHLGSYAWLRPLYLTEIGRLMSSRRQRGAAQAARTGATLLAETDEARAHMVYLRESVARLLESEHATLAHLRQATDAVGTGPEVHELLETAAALLAESALRIAGWCAAADAVVGGTSIRATDVPRGGRSMSSAELLSGAAIPVPTPISAIRTTVVQDPPARDTRGKQRAPAPTAPVAAATTGPAPAEADPELARALAMSMVPQPPHTASALVQLLAGVSATAPPPHPSPPAPAPGDPPPVAPYPPGSPSESSSSASSVPVPDPAASLGPPVPPPRVASPGPATPPPVHSPPSPTVQSPPSGPPRSPDEVLAEHRRGLQEAARRARDGS